MPAKSKKQQKFFGIVHNCQKTGSKKGICASKKIRKAVSSISDKDAKDFASTSHKGLPEKVDENQYTSFKEWFNSFYLQEKSMSNKDCKCGCNSCKHGDCMNCTCKNCKCENCTCH